VGSKIIYGTSVVSRSKELLAENLLVCPASRQDVLVAVVITHMCRKWMRRCHRSQRWGSCPCVICQQAPVETWCVPLDAHNVLILSSHDLNQHRTTPTLSSSHQRLPPLDVFCVFPHALKQGICTGQAAAARGRGRRRRPLRARLLRRPQRVQELRRCQLARRLALKHIVQQGHHVP